MSSSGAYAGDVTPEDAWATLQAEPSAVLVDVRTVAEWSFVGVPDLGSLGKQPAFQEWQSYPSMQVDPGFMDRVADAIGETGGADAPVFFLCRSGARSQAAAAAMAGRGFTRCYNIAGGFEGPLDAARHRGAAAGWKAAGLPWMQS